MTTLTSAQRDENRLTDADRERMRARVAEVLRLHKASSVAKDWTPWWSDTATYERVAMHAIGCDQRDLRQSEADEVAELVAQWVGLVVMVGAVRWRASTAGRHGCDPCDRCGFRPREGARIWFESHGDLSCDPCLQARR